MVLGKLDAPAPSASCLTPIQAWRKPIKASGNGSKASGSRSKASGSRSKARGSGIQMNVFRELSLFKGLDANPNDFFLRLLNPAKPVPPPPRQAAPGSSAKATLTQVRFFRKQMSPSALLCPLPPLGWLSMRLRRLVSPPRQESRDRDVFVNSFPVQAKAADLNRLALPFASFEKTGKPRVGHADRSSVRQLDPYQIVVEPNRLGRNIHVTSPSSS